MKKLALCAVALMIVSAASVITAKEDEKKDPLKEAKCVVSGKDINPKATAEYREGKVYFCCPGCPGAFAKNKEKYAVKANHQLVVTGQYKQVGCPLSGKPAKEGVAVKVAGVEVGLCCKGCEGKAKKAEKDELVALLFSDKVFEKGFELVKE